MPARAPCPEVAEAVKEQAHFVRVAKLMSELVAATAPPPPDQTPIAALPPSAPLREQRQAFSEQAEKTVARCRAKLAAAKPATGSKPQSKLQVHVVSAMKDQSATVGAEPAKPAAMAANAAAKHRPQ
jgi:hypothetical protein